MIRTLKRSCLLSLIVISALSLYANGINTNSQGAKARAMGGAFIGLANDYSAVFWNPAGLIQMEKDNLTVCGNFGMPTVTYKTDFYTAYGLPSIDASTKKKVYVSPFIAYYNVISPKLVIGVALYSPAVTGAEWDGADLTNLSPDFQTIYDWKGGLVAVTAAPVIAYKFSHTFSIGLALNLNYAMMNTNRAISLGQYREESNGMSFGATIGALFKPNEFLSIGVNWRAPSKFKLSGDAEMPGAGIIGLSTTSKAEREVVWPMWGGVGIALKPSRQLTFTADAQYSNWKKMDKVGIIYSDVGWKAAGMEARSEMDLSWKDTIQWRFGVQYMINKVWALRGGYLVDPAPSPNTRLNILFPGPDGGWITLGFGINTPKFNLDMGLDYYLFRNERVSDDPIAIAERKTMPGIHGSTLLLMSLSFTYKF
jgi:long-chain fatty acid transport protein